MQKLVSANRQKKNINEQLMECWNTVVNPFSTTLHILENVYMFETGMLNIWICKQVLSNCWNGQQWHSESRKFF